MSLLLLLGLVILLLPLSMLALEKKANTLHFWNHGAFRVCVDYYAFEQIGEKGCNLKPDSKSTFKSEFFAARNISGRKNLRCIDPTKEIKVGYMLNPFVWECPADMNIIKKIPANKFNGQMIVMNCGKTTLNPECTIDN